MAQDDGKRESNTGRQGEMAARVGSVRWQRGMAVQDGNTIWHGELVI